MGGMVSLLLICVMIAYLTFLLPAIEEYKQKRTETVEETPQAKKLWAIAQESMKKQNSKQHMIRAEKALLALLDFDAKNAAAYNRLGILYTKEQRYDEATRCFEIAQSLDKNPALFHNTGLIYLEIGEFEKAVMAFRQALELEGDLPARFIALAKAEEKLGHLDEALEALESAFELDGSVATLRQILSIYELAKDPEGIANTTARIEEQIVKNNLARRKKLSTVSKRFSEFKRGLSKSDEMKKAPVQNSATQSRNNVKSSASTQKIIRVSRVNKRMVEPNHDEANVVMDPKVSTTTNRQILSRQRGHGRTKNRLIQ